MVGRFLFQKLSSRISSSLSGSGLTRLLLTSPLRSAAVSRSAARYFNTLPWTSSAAKTISTTNGMASAIAHRAKPAFVDNSAGLKPTFSSNSPNKDTATCEAKHAAWEAEMKAKMSDLEYRSASEAELEADKKAIVDDFKAWKTKFEKDVADFRSYFTCLVVVWTLVGLGFIFESNRRSFVEGKGYEMAANDNADVRRPSAP